MTLINRFVNFATDAQRVLAAEVFSYFGSTGQAERIYRRQVAHRTSYLGANHLHVALAQFRLANTLISRKAPSVHERVEAWQLLTTLRPTFEREYGECSMALGQVIYRLGLSADLNGDFANAEQLYRQAHVMFKYHAPSWFLEHAELCERLAGILADNDVRAAFGFSELARSIRRRNVQMKLYGRYARYYFD